MVKPRDVGVRASPHTPTSYGASASSRIFEKTDGRRPNACTATARSRTNVPPSTIIATRWRRQRLPPGRIRGKVAVSVVREPGRPLRIGAWHPTPSSSCTASGSRRAAGSTGSTHYEAKGYRVIAPGYPGFEVEVEALRENPQIIVDVTVPAIIEKIEAVIRELDKPPIIMGHSAGGAFTQVLLDHGFGAAGVALNSAPTEGVRVVPLSQVKSTLPVLKSPANRHKAVGLTLEQWTYAFTNTFTEEESQGAVRALPHPGQRRHPVGQRAGELPAGTAGDLGRLPQRQAGAAAVRLRQRGPHHAAGDPEVEQEALQVRDGHRDPGVRRATRTCCRPRRAGSRSPTRSSTGPWSTLVDPHPHRRARPCSSRSTAGGCSPTRPSTPPAGTTRFGWGTSSDKLTGPAVAVADLPPIDAVLLTHDHHGDNLDTAGRAAAASAGTVVTTVGRRAPARRAGARGLAAGDGDPPDRARPTDLDSHRHAGTARTSRCRGRSSATSSASRAPAGRATRCSSGSPATPCCYRRPARRPREAHVGRRRCSCTSAACGSRSPARCGTR